MLCMLYSSQHLWRWPNAVPMLHAAHPSRDRPDVSDVGPMLYQWCVCCTALNVSVILARCCTNVVYAAPLPGATGRVSSYLFACLDVRSSPHQPVLTAVSGLIDPGSFQASRDCTSPSGHSNTLNIPILHRSVNIPILNCCVNMPILHCSVNMLISHCSVNMPISHCSVNLLILHYSVNMPILHCSFNMLISQCSVNMPILHCSVNMLISHCSVNMLILQCSVNMAISHRSVNMPILHYGHIDRFHVPCLPCNQTFCNEYYILMKNLERLKAVFIQASNAFISLSAPFGC